MGVQKRRSAKPVLQRWEIFILAYPLGFSVPLIGSFYHTAPVICPAGLARMPRDSMTLSSASSVLPHGCVEVPYYRDNAGVELHSPGRWPNRDPNADIVVSRAGTKDLLGSPGRTAFDVAEELRQYGSRCRDGKWLDFNAGTYSMLNHNCNSWTLRVMEKLELHQAIGILRQFTLENVEINPSLRGRLDTAAKWGGAWLAGMSSDEFNGGKITRKSEKCFFN